jgi:hypothetical protein
MTREERNAERKAYREAIAEVNSWKKQSQAELSRMSQKERLDYLFQVGEDLRINYGIKHLSAIA